LARTLNFTQASEKLFIAQPNLSKHIAQMEDEIGVQLFIRSKRSVNLTEAGKLLYERLDGMPQRMETAFEQARALCRGENGRLAIGMLEGQELCPELLERLARFEERFPNIELILERAGFSRLRDGLASGCYDAVITLSFDVIDNPDFIYDALFTRGGGVIAINRNNPLSRQEDLRLVDLRGESFVVISPEESPRGYGFFIEECRNAGFEPRVARKLSSLESLMLCVEAGLGIALLDHNIRLENNKDICMIGIPDSPLTYLGLVWRAGDDRQIVKNLVFGMRQP